VLACPFGVPKMKVGFDLMMKCDMCYDRTSVGKKPMCATVCPSGALYYGPREFVERFRSEKPVNEFQFGRQTVRTKVNMMTSPQVKALPFDVLDFLPFEGQDIDPLSLASSGAPDAADEAVWEELELKV
jgi:Fe-S-cluster-containing dehydrogenase component